MNAPDFKPGEIDDIIRQFDAGESISMLARLFKRWPNDIREILIIHERREHGPNADVKTDGSFTVRTTRSPKAAQELVEHAIAAGITVDWIRLVPKGTTGTDIGTPGVKREK